jgi:hypothetical protein
MSSRSRSMYPPTTCCGRSTGLSTFKRSGRTWRPSIVASVGLRLRGGLREPNPNRSRHFSQKTRAPVVVARQRGKLRQAGTSRIFRSLRGDIVSEALSARQSPAAKIPFLAAGWRNAIATTANDPKQCFAAVVRHYFFLSPVSAPPSPAIAMNISCIRSASFGSKLNQL